MKLQSSLISGAGNTFHIYYNVPEVVPTAELVKNVCQQFPADGVVFLKAPTGREEIYGWDFFNNDGSRAEMCGNATRCVGYYVENILALPTQKMKLMTTAGLIQIEILGKHQYQVYMTEPKLMPQARVFACNTGVPHVVIEIPQGDQFDFYKSQAKEIRNSIEFAPHGTNVTLIQRTDKESVIKAVSFERGVEDFTLACGTGAVAAGFYMRIKYKKDKTTVEMPGGTLNIDMADLRHPVMTGPAEHLKDCMYEFNI